jgi:hypothetical protein
VMLVFIMSMVRVFVIWLRMRMLLLLLPVLPEHLILHLDAVLGPFLPQAPLTLEALETNAILLDSLD